MSSGSPTRPIGMPSFSAAAFSAASTMSTVRRVRISPGQIALTLIRSWPNETAIARVSARTAPLEAA